MRGMKMGRKSSAVYEINYHIVWYPKYRKAILVKEYKKFLEEVIKTIAYTKNWEILETEIMPDHIHLFISTDPFESPTNIVKILKGITAKRMFERFPELKENHFWNSGLWSPSYYIGTAGQVSAETIKKYIAGENNRKRNSSSG